MHLEGAHTGNEDVVNNGCLFHLLSSRPTTGQQGICCLQEWIRGREVNGLCTMSGTAPRPWVPLEEVSKTSSCEGKAALASTPVKAEDSPSPALPAQLKFQSADDGRVHGQKQPR